MLYTFNPKESSSNKLYAYICKYIINIYIYNYNNLSTVIKVTQFTGTELKKCTAADL